jgi:hypothetical protein
MRRPSHRFSTLGSAGLALSFAIAALAGCSLINAPDDVKDPGAGGSGGSGGSGGAPPSCTKDDDCTSLTTDCADGKCDTTKGQCEAAPKPADTPCGAAPASTCDLADVCDGAGKCTNNTVPDGTYCEDCAAGPGKCSLCQVGKCNDCTTRATEKSFRNPQALAGWEVTGSWGIFEATPQRRPNSNTPACSDTFDNDGDGLIDYPNDPNCTGPDDPGEGIPGCSDGVDNDGDGFIDFPNDPGCTSADDEDETVEGAIAFDHPVLGSDGNRAHPYNQINGEREQSTALSPPTVLGSTLTFLSWNLDEGFSYDKKAVAITTDGVSFTTLYACPACTPNGTDPSLYCFDNSGCCSGNCNTAINKCEPAPTCSADGQSCTSDAECCNAACVGQTCGPPPAFCRQRTDDRPADAWDAITLSVPPSLVGKVGRVQLKYDTRDSCCNFERGWYIDALNFATDCACSTAADCGYLDATCATGNCDAATKECRPTPKSEGNACTRAGTASCSMSTCDANGFCNPNGEEFEGDLCTSCSDPDQQCLYCESGTCASCPDVQTFLYTDNVYKNFDQTFWAFTGNWGLQSCAPANSLGTYTCFPQPADFNPLAAHIPPALGSFGSRNALTPFGSASMSGTATTSTSTLPATLTFNSWHQDRGGNDTFNLRDKKQVLVSVDDGASWTVLVDCSGNQTIPFCQPWANPAANRALDQWDPISISIQAVDATLVGKPGKIRFTYDTVDAGQGWERGWYIDDINVSRCD